MFMLTFISCVQNIKRDLEDFQFEVVCNCDLSELNLLIAIIVFC